MSFLVLDASESTRESLCYALLSFGIKGIPVADRRTALVESGQTPGLEGAIVDIDSKELGGIQFIQELKANPQTQHLKIIVHTIRSSKETVTRMIELGVMGYLLKPYKQDEIFAKLKKIFAKFENHNKQRKHIRVKPDPQELLRLHFRLPDQQGLISGKILDISVGGVAAELFNPPAEGILQPGTLIDEVQFVVGGKPLSPPAKVILSRGKLLALHFEALSAMEKTSLARYIFKRIST